MIRRSAIIATEVVVGLLAVLALLLGLAFWRLTAGPVDLDFLTPEIEAALSDPSKGFEVRIGKTQLTWGGANRTVDLHARQVRVIGDNGAILAALPDVVLRLSLRALARGTIAPTMVEMTGARVSLLRRQDGSFHFGPWDDTGAGEGGQSALEGDFSHLVPRAIARLLDRPDPDDPWSFLRVVRILDGSVAVNDRVIGSVWSAPHADIELRRDQGGLSGELALKLDLGERQADILVLFNYSTAAERIDLTARFSDVIPKSIVSLFPGLSAAGGLTMPLAGSVSASLDAGFSLMGLDFVINGGAGQFDRNDLFAAPLPVRSLRAEGSLTTLDRRVVLESAVIEFGGENEPGPRLILSGAMTSAAEGFSGDLDITATVQAENVDMAKLGRYWPLTLAPDTRAWVLENVDGGLARKAILKTSLTVPDGDFSIAELHEFGGTLEYADISVHFLRPLPPVTGISGTADFDDDRLSFYPLGGSLGQIKIEEASIEITGLKHENEAIAIEIVAVGPLQDTLELLDHDRLKLIRALDMTAGSIQGSLAARIGFEFPLLKDLGFDDIEISAAANLAQVTAKGLLLGQDMTDGRLKMTLDKAGMVLSGPLIFAGIGMDITWSEAFTENPAEQTRVEIKADRVDAKGRAALGIDLDAYLTGPMSAHVIVRRDATKNTVIEVELDLRDTRLEAIPIPWEKPAGVEGTAVLTLELSDDRLQRISKFDIEAGAMRARGGADFDRSGTKLDKISFSELAFDATSLRGVELDLTQKTLGIRIQGGVLDATPWLVGEAALEDRATPGPNVPAEPPITPLRFSAPNLDAVIFGSDRYLEQVKIDVERSAAGWEKASMRGAVPKSLWGKERGEAGDDATPRTITVDYGTASEGGKRLLITVQDMGAVLRALDIADGIDGGRLQIIGTSAGPLPGAKLSGRIEGHDYVLVDAPNMARLLSLASLTGIGDALQNEGIGFQRLVGEFTLEDSVMRTDLIRAYGPALGLTAKGSIDFERNETALQGTIVPAYTVNRIIGEIPLLGPLLTGGEGEGVFAVTYKATGPVSKPEVSVNPLAVLAPGFLRNLFSGSNVSEEELRAMPEREEP